MKTFPKFRCPPHDTTVLSEPGSVGLQQKHSWSSVRGPPKRAEDGHPWKQSLWSVALQWSYIMLTNVSHSSETPETRPIGGKCESVPALQDCQNNQKVKRLKKTRATNNETMAKHFSNFRLSLGAVESFLIHWPCSMVKTMYSPKLFAIMSFRSKQACLMLVWKVHVSLKESILVAYNQFLAVFCCWNWTDEDKWGTIQGRRRTIEQDEWSMQHVWWETEPSQSNAN